jgi:hypothetical protein
MVLSHVSVAIVFASESLRAPRAVRAVCESAVEKWCWVE